MDHTASIHTVLDEFRHLATGPRDKGEKFERLIASYLRTDPMYKEKYSEVWLWTEWPDRGNQPDVGIDLVAKDRDTNEYCAIQCKFYEPTHTLQKSDIDSFFTASGQSFPTRLGTAKFATRLIVSTTDKWSKHAAGSLTLLIFAVPALLIGAGVTKLWEVHFVGKPMVCLGLLGGTV